MAEIIKAKTIKSPKLEAQKCHVKVVTVLIILFVFFQVHNPGIGLLRKDHYNHKSFFSNVFFMFLGVGGSFSVACFVVLVGCRQNLKLLADILVQYINGMALMIVKVIHV